MIFAQENNRPILGKDTTFVLNSKAKAMIAKEGKDNVLNGVIGALYDDEGNLALMASVVEENRELEAIDFFEYAPIKGLPAYREAVIKDLFRDYQAKRFVEAVATTGGTGTISSAIANYTQRFDTVLTSDWYWAPYNSLCIQQERKLETFEFFKKDGSFNIEGMAEKIKKIAKEQKRLLILLNTPCHNPTGYSLSTDDWDKLISVINDNEISDASICLLVDISYLEFSGDIVDSRKFLPKLDELNDNVLALIGYSASKSYTAYGARTGAVICMAQTREIADEFLDVSEYFCRNTWSNSSRAGQTIVANIWASEDKVKRIDRERTAFREMLQKRGQIFENEARRLGLDVVPFSAGFFVCIACDNSTEVSRALEEKGAFVLPLKKGIRISIASLSEKKCLKMARLIAEVMKKD